MGQWGTAIKDNDAFSDIYSEFFKLYNEGEQPVDISQKILSDNWEMLEIESENHSLWFALSLAQWETKSLDKKVLLMVEGIILSGDDLKLWYELGASDQDIKKRKIVLAKFLEKIKSDRPKAKPRKRPRLKTPIFSTGDCVVFKLKTENYGGAIIIATDSNPETAYNLVATTRLNKEYKPTIKDFENVEILVCNFGQWQDRPDIAWHSPDLFYKRYSGIYEVVGSISIETQYEVKNYAGEGYPFKPSFTAGWNMNFTAGAQFESEVVKPRPSKVILVTELTNKT